jgi:predicted Holliday junction resolvase-like endonuclease
MKQNSNLPSTKHTVLVGVGVLLLFVLGFWGCPTYRVWQQSKEGEAELKRAEQNRQIKIQEAMAAKESALMLAQADTIRAHGIARSNQIIGASLTEAYLHWFWIDNIDKSDNVIYVPTEANMPIMEAGRLFQKQLNVQE